MVRRLPALETVTEVTSWAGLYEMTPDHNPVLGFHPGLDGLIFANGFSGHGLMMSPATGKIVSELVCLDAPRRSTSASSRPIASIAERWCTTQRRFLRR